MTIQTKMKELLEKTGIAHKEIRCYGSQIVITAACRDTADKWAMVLNKFSRKVKVLEALEEAKTNQGTCLLPTVVTVFRTYATV